MEKNWAALIADLKGIGMSDSDIADAVNHKKFGASAVRWIRANPKTAPRYEAAIKLQALHKRIMRNRARAA